MAAKAIITGASKGIGLAIATHLAQSGYDLIICSRTQSEIEVVANQLQDDYDVAVSPFVVDMSASTEVQAFGQKCLEIGDIEVLVNNAGVFFPGSILEEPQGNLEMMVNTNLYSAYHLTRIIAPHMVNKQRGHIFNMCSIASQIAYPNGGSYSISKFALLGFSKVLREELKPQGVKVTSILPGATWSASWAGVDLPEDRLMKANDIAIAVMGALSMSPSAVVEEIVIRPQLGDL